MASMIAVKSLSIAACKQWAGLGKSANLRAFSFLQFKTARRFRVSSGRALNSFTILAWRF